MMKTIEISLPGTVSSVKHYLPLIDPCRLVSAKVSCSTAQTDAAVISLAKKDVSNKVLIKDLKPASANYVAGTVVDMARGGDTTDLEFNQVFGPKTPLEIDINLQANGQITLQIVVDPFLIGSRQKETGA